MKKRCVLALLAAACLPLATPAARADTVAFATTPSGQLDPGGSNLTFGYTFTLASPIQVTRLGFWDYQADGFKGTVTVTLWNSARAVQATTTLPTGTTAGEINQYLYVTLAAPVTLAAGTYTIAGTAAGFFDRSEALVSTLTVATGITFGAARSGEGNNYPTGDPQGAGGNSYFGSNFQFNAVPEPSTWAAAAGAGLMGIIALRRRAAALA